MSLWSLITPTPLCTPFFRSNPPTTLYVLPAFLPFFVKRKRATQTETEGDGTTPMRIKTATGWLPLPASNESLAKFLGPTKKPNASLFKPFYYVQDSFHF